MSEILEKKIKQIAREVAHEDWDKRSGFGLYHAGQAVQEAEFAAAEKKVRGWLAYFEEAIRDDEKARIAKLLASDGVYYQIDDNYGSSGTEALKVIIETLEVE